MTAEERRGLLEEYRRRRASKIYRYFPDCQPGCKPASLDKKDHVGLCRVLYRPHLTLFGLGALYRERLFLKANRSGGTQAAAFEVTCHLTGNYPHWWVGRRFDEAGEWWAAGETATTTRDVPQSELWGPPTAPRTGMIPGHLIVDRSMKSGVPDGIDTLWVKHKSGGVATLQFKSFKEGRTSFQGTAKQGIWLDEEPDTDIPEECILRTMTTGGILLYTFTPLKGLTPFVASFLETCDMLTTEGSTVLAKAEFWKQANLEAAA